MIYSPSTLHFEKQKNTNTRRNKPVTVPISLCMRCKQQKTVSKGCKRPTIGFIKRFICADCAHAA